METVEVEVRRLLDELLRAVRELTTDKSCREYSLTLTKVEEAMMWFDKKEKTE